MDESPMFFKDWAEIGRGAAMAVLAYAGFILFLRISGPRTLAKMNVFDFVFVVALGSTLAHTIMDPRLTLLKGLGAVAVLILLQFTISWLTRHSKVLERIINGEPILLFFKGHFLEDTMRRERVTREEIRAAIRNKGLGPLEVVHAVVLETDGTFSVVWRMVDKAENSLSDVARQEEEVQQATGQKQG
jgi:uncharacterized membrane protein YcaP (DUF421 family)